MLDAPLKALLIEDNRASALLMREYLARAGFDCDHAETLEKGLRALNNDGYAVVITDLRLEKIFGTIILERISEANHGVALGVATGMYLEEEALESMRKYGVLFYLDKVADLTARKDEKIDDMVERLRRILHGAIAQQEWINEALAAVKAEATATARAEAAIAIADAHRGVEIAVAKASQLEMELTEWRKRPPARRGMSIKLQLALVAAGVTLLTGLLELLKALVTGK